MLDKDKMARDIVEAVTDASYWIGVAKNQVGIEVTKSGGLFRFYHEAWGIDMKASWQDVGPISEMICRSYARGVDQVKKEVRDALDDI